MELQATFDAHESQYPVDWDVDEVMDASERELFKQGTVKAFNEKRISFHVNNEERDIAALENSDSVPNMASRALNRQRSSLKNSSRNQRSFGKQASIFQRIDKVLAEISDDDEEDNDDDEDYEAIERELLMLGLTLEETKRELASRKSLKKKGYHPDHQLMKDDRTKHEFQIQADGSATVTVQDNLAMRKAFLFYCKSAINAKDMHRAPILPQMAADMFVVLCKDLSLVEPIGPLSMMTLGITYASFKEDEDDGLSYPSFLDSLVELAFDARRNVAALLQTMMEEDLPQLQIKRLKEEEREQLKRSPPSTEFNGHRVPSSPSAAGGNLSPAITNQQRPQSSALAMGTGATPTAWKSPANGSGGGGGERPGTSNLIGGGRGSLTSDFRAQTPLYGLGVKSGSLERESNPIEFSSSPILAASPLETMNVPPKPVVPKTTAFGGVALKPESKPARTIMPSAAGGKGQGKGTSLAEAAARQLKEEMRAEAEAAPTIRLNPNLKSKTPPTSSSNVVQESPVSVHRAPLVVAADDDDDDEDEGGEWGASRTDYSAAELSTEQEIEHIAPSEFRPQRVSGAGQGNSIMSTRNSNGTSAVSPSTDKTPAASAPQQPLFAKRTAASDDGGAARKAQLPTLDSKGAKKGLAKASTGSRASNEANTTLLSKAASSRTTKTVYASPPLSKAPTATRTSNNANASLLTKAGSSRMSNSGGAPPSLTKAPTATRASNSDGFVPMKIDWNKASDSSLSASAFGAGDAKASTSTLSRSGSKRFSSNGVAAPASNSSLLPKASTMERTSPSLLTKTGSTRVSSSGGAPPPSLTKAPTATRGSNNNGFTPMKIDWNKASDSAGK